MASKPLNLLYLSYFGMSYKDMCACGDIPHREITFGKCGNAYQGTGAQEGSRQRGVWCCLLHWLAFLIQLIASLVWNRASVNYLTGYCRNVIRLDVSSMVLSWYSTKSQFPSEGWYGKFLQKAISWKSKAIKYFHFGVNVNLVGENVTAHCLCG